MDKLSFLFLAFLLVGCSSKKPPATVSEPIRYYGGSGVKEALNGLIAQPYSDTTQMEIFYATNRSKGALSEPCNNKTFTVYRSDLTSFGSCLVNVPKNHAIGTLPQPTEDSDNPHDYFIGMSNRPMTQEDLFKKLDANANHDVLVFVHGFNVDFQESVFRAAQLAYDLKFQGSVVVFSWPAGAAAGMIEGARVDRTYGNNQINAKKTIDSITDFFQAMSIRSQTLHVLAHSMGHQVLIPALTKVSATSPVPFIGELVLNAPDFEVKEFKSSIPALQKISKRITLYCSVNDKAMYASQTYNNNQRLGACANIPEIDVINVSELDSSILGLGHGYYASRPILSDIFQTLLGIDAEKRLFIQKSTRQGSEKFFLRP